MVFTDLNTGIVITYFRYMVGMTGKDIRTKSIKMKSYGEKLLYDVDRKIPKIQDTLSSLYTKSHTHERIANKCEHSHDAFYRYVHTMYSVTQDHHFSQL
jgi:hypothetical protein